MRLRIVSTGIGATTQITNADTGEEILPGMIQAIEWKVNAEDQAAQIILTLWGAKSDVDLIGDVQETHEIR